mgnify:CR=1 FL=1
MIVHADDLSVSPHLIIHGTYDPALTRYLGNHLEAGKVFVDVGANMGYFTILAGLLVGAKGKVIAFEANTDHYRLIKENVALNYLSDHTLVFHAAVYSEATRLTFHASERFQGNSSIFPHDDEYKKFYDVDTFTTYEIDAVALDDVLIDLPYIDIIKLDIEGGEYRAFLGMNKLIEKQAIGTIVFEWNKRMLGNDWMMLVRQLAMYQDMHGYQFFFLNKEGNLQPISLETLVVNDGIPNVVMTKQTG